MKRLAITNLRFADDTDAITEEPEAMVESIDKNCTRS